MSTQIKEPSVAAKVTTAKEREIRIERVFEASRQRVWRAFTDPKLLAQWWGRGHEVRVERLELRRGGHWRFVERTDEGDQGFEGRFGEVKEPELIEQTFAWDGLPGHVLFETVTFEELGEGRTRVITVSLAHTAEDRDGIMSMGMEEGMNQRYAALDSLLKKGF